MVHLTVSLVVALCCSVALSDLLIKDSTWQAWKLFHNKKYESVDEESLRYTIWNENLKIIQRHNADKQSSFSMQMNHLGDMVCDHFFFFLLSLFTEINDVLIL